MLQIAHLDMNLERQFVPTTLHDALESDEISSNPLSSKDDDVVTPPQIDGKFNDVSYNKGNICRFRKYDVLDNKG